MFSFFKRKPAQPKQPIIVARLNARLMPLDRGEVFEDPLDAALRSKGVGQVTGGSTQLADEPDRVAFCDVEIGVNTLTDARLEAVIAELCRLGAPKGSHLLIGTDRPAQPFGVLEGLGLYLNGLDLPDEVYANSDINGVIAALQTALGPALHYMGHWQGEVGTALYFYGADFAHMQAAITASMPSHPLCQGARIVQIA